MDYKSFLEKKVIIAEKFGFKPFKNKDVLLPHQNVIVDWCINGGRRLNSQYFADGLFHLKSLEYKLSVPTLFDLF